MERSPPSDAGHHRQQQPEQRVPNAVLNKGHDLSRLFEYERKESGPAVAWRRNTEGMGVVGHISKAILIWAKGPSGLNDPVSAATVRSSLNTVLRCPEVLFRSLRFG